MKNMQLNYNMRNLKLSALVFVSLCIIGVLTLSFYKNNANPQPVNINVDIDCSNPITQAKSMIGFLHSLNPQKPTSDLIEPLHPKYWRISSRNPRVIARTKTFGAQPIFAVSDVFRYASADNDFKKTPVLLMRQWKDTVKSVMFQHRAEKIKLIYDIWNEPNVKQFWSGSNEEFFDSYKNGYDQIRGMVGGSTAMISGPSISRFDLEFLGKFLDYCLANKMTLDVLSWHEFKSEEDIPKVADDILLAKSMFVNNPKYAALHIKSVQINEIIPKSDQFSPGSIVAYFTYLEKGGADGACKACWPEANGKSNCFNNSLDGLIDAESMQPRAAWWAYNYYNLSLANRLKYSSNNSHVVGFANYQTNNVQVLLGYYGNKAANAAVTNVNVSLRNIKSLAAFATKSTVNISVLSIPNTGENVMVAPNATYQTTAAISNGQLNFSIPQLYLSGACVVNIN
jgi:xylan 1,4-beta-xylosidase